MDMGSMVLKKDNGTGHGNLGFRVPVENRLDKNMENGAGAGYVFRFEGRPIPLNWDPKRNFGESPRLFGARI